MTIIEEQHREFEELTRPLMKWLNENCHPHVTVIVSTTSAELTEGVCAIHTNDYVRD